MQANPALAIRLPRVSGLIVEGLTPAPQVLTPAVLQAVHELFLSELCRCDTLPLARKATAVRLTSFVHDEGFSEDEDFQYDPASLYCDWPGHPD